MITVKNRGTETGNPGLLRVWANQPQTQGCAAPGHADISLASLAAGAIRTVRITLPAGTACGAAGDAALSVGTLDAGASRTLTLDGLPAGTAAAKSLRAFIDTAGVSAEAFDSNNQRAKPYTVVP